MKRILVNQISYERFIYLCNKEKSSVDEMFDVILNYYIENKLNNFKKETMEKFNEELDEFWES